MNEEIKAWLKHQKLLGMIVDRMSPEAQKEYYEKHAEVICEVLEEAEE